jgi:muconolactone delta-isomerase
VIEIGSNHAKGARDMKEFLVELKVCVPAGTPGEEVERRRHEESIAAAGLAAAGHLVRLWTRPLLDGGATMVGLYRAGTAAELDGLLGHLPLGDWLRWSVTPLESHPSDPAVVA